MKVLHIIQTVLLLLIGLVSLFMSTSVIFDWFGIRAQEGNFVPFIVYANFICAFIYLFAAYMGWQNPKYQFYSLLLASALLVVAFMGLWFYIHSGGLYETKTVKAMIFRLSFTVAMTLIGFFLFRKSRLEKRTN